MHSDVLQAALTKQPHTIPISDEFHLHVMKTFCKLHLQNNPHTIPISDEFHLHVMNSMDVIDSFMGVTILAASFAQNASRLICL